MTLVRDSLGKRSTSTVALTPRRRPAFCLCSVGYVKEMHERTFGRSCEVELLDSVLYGGKRCRFRITVSPAV